MAKKDNRITMSGYKAYGLLVDNKKLVPMNHIYIDESRNNTTLDYIVVDRSSLWSGNVTQTDPETAKIVPKSQRDISAMLVLETSREWYFFPNNGVQ